MNDIYIHMNDSYNAMTVMLQLMSRFSIVFRYLCYMISILCNTMRNFGSGTGSVAEILFNAHNAGNLCVLLICQNCKIVKEMT